jgi:hypothetical protein
LPPRLVNWYTGRLLDGVRETRYGDLVVDFAVPADAGSVGVVADVAAAVWVWVAGSEAAVVRVRRHATGSKVSRLAGAAVRRRV